MIISNEVLPEPEGPTMATDVAAGMEKLTDFRISTAPARLSSVSPTSDRLTTGDKFGADLAKGVGSVMVARIPGLALAVLMNVARMAADLSNRHKRSSVEWRGFTARLRWVRAALATVLARLLTWA